MKVFLEKDGKRKEVGVELRIQGARKAFWFVEMKPQPSQQPKGEGQKDKSVAEVVASESTTEVVADGSTTIEEGGQSVTEDAPG